MKNLVTLLLCATSWFNFSDSFEHGRIHHHRDARRHHARHHSGRSHSCSDDNDTSTEDTSIEFYYHQGGPNDAGFLNVSAHIAAIFNYSSPTVLILNGETGTGLGINVLTHTVYELNNTWKIPESFETYFNSLNSTGKLIQSGRPIPFNETYQPNSTVWHQLDQALTQLGIPTNTIPLNRLVELSLAYNTLHYTSLGGLLHGDGHFHLDDGGISRFNSVLKGLNALFSNYPGGVTAALAKNVTSLDLQSIFNSRNGAEALIGILKQLGPNFDLSKALQGSLTNQEQLLNIITKLGGNSSTGINAVFNVILQLLRGVGGHNSGEQFIETILSIAQSGGLHFNQTQIQSLIHDLEGISSPQVKDLVKVLHQLLVDLQNGGLSSQGINISEVITLLRSGNFSGVIEVVVHILIRISNVVNPAQSIPRLIGRLLTLFNSTHSGSNPFGVPGISPETIQKIEQDILHGKTPNITDIPGLGPLLGPIQHALQNSTNGSLNLGDLINSSSGLTIIVREISHGNGLWGLASQFNSTFQQVINELPHIFPIFGLEIQTTRSTEAHHDDSSKTTEGHHEYSSAFTKSAPVDITTHILESTHPTKDEKRSKHTQKHHKGYKKHEKLLH